MKNTYRWEHSTPVSFDVIFKYELMITPDLIVELTTWLDDPYFINSRRQFNAVHEKTLELVYDNFVPENHLEFHTGNVP